MLVNHNSSRVTYAAVFIPKDESKPHEFILPEGIRLANGFNHYDHHHHHKSKNEGTLCCGNCYSENKLVEIHHRKPTAERIGGGDMRGHHATFCANPNTIDQHTSYCQERRENHDEEEFLKYGITFNVNMAETYSTRAAPHRAHTVKKGHKIEVKDERLENRKSVAINMEIAELIKPAAGLTRMQAQNAMYVIDGKVYTHSEIFVDGDGWKDVTRDKSIYPSSKPFFGGPKLFHLTIPTSKNLRSFNEAAENIIGDEVKISCRQYEFKDWSGRVHIVQPSLHVKRSEVKKLFEAQGEYLVLGRFHHVPVNPRTQDGVTVHQIKIAVDSPNMAVQLYNTTKRQIRDYDAMRNFERNSADVLVIDPKIKAAPHKKTTLPPSNQPDLFSSPGLQ